MQGEIARTSDWEGESWQVRTEIMPERVCIDQRDTDLAELFWYWQERLMLEDGVPSIENFRFPGSDLPWIELEPEDPMRFVIRNHPANAATGDWSNFRIAEHPVSMHAQCCAFEYLDCKERQEPTFIHIDQKILGVHRTYAKLMVPVADKNGAIIRAYYAVRLLRFPVVYGGAS
ncbi:MAG: hypothetical protein GKS00_23685 [Alphaproteobacteria bacterium]|nr:hypothetical protein [Alphaproteobacteria bacterium]